MKCKFEKNKGHHIIILITIITKEYLGNVLNRIMLTTLILATTEIDLPSLMLITINESLTFELR